MKLIWVGDRDITATVGELVKELQKFDPNLPVKTEGCDCYGNVVKVSFYGNLGGSKGCVLIERDDNAVDVKFDEDNVAREEYIGRIINT